MKNYWKNKSFIFFWITYGIGLTVYLLSSDYPRVWHKMLGAFLVAIGGSLVIYISERKQKKQRGRDDSMPQ